MKIVTLLIASLSLWTASLAQSTYSSVVNFTSASAELDPNAMSVLQAFADSCLTYDFIAVSLEGHTDTQGDGQFNELLAQDRVTRVYETLVRMGVDPDELEIASFGESRPFVEEESEQDRAVNRRVVLKAELKTVSDISDVYTYLSKRFQHSSSYAHDVGATITAPQGSVVNVPAHAFELNGKDLPEGALVELMVEEGVSPASIVAHRLNTNGNAGNLGTGGMIRVSAYWEGSELSLKQEKALQVKMPIVNEQEGMNLYVGARGASERVAWTEVNEEDGQSRLDIVSDVSVDFDGPKVPVQALRALAEQMQEVGFKKRPPFLKFTPLPAAFDVEQGKPKSPYKPRKPKRKIAGKPRGLFAKLGNQQAQKQAQYDQEYELAQEIYAEKRLTYDRALSEYQVDNEAFKNSLAERWSAYMAHYDSIVQIRVGEAEAYVSAYNKSFATQAIIYRQRYFSKVDSAAELWIVNRLLEDDFAPISALSKEQPASFGVFYAKALGLPELVKKSNLNRFEKELSDSLNLRHERRLNQSELNFQYVDVLSEVNKESGNAELTSKLVELVEAYLSEYRLYNAEKRSQVAGSLNNSLRFYEFEIRAPRPTWYNIDHPLLAGEYQFGLDKRGLAEAYCYLPSERSFEYFPGGIRAANVYALPHEVRFLSFKVGPAGLEIAVGEGKASKSRELAKCVYQKGTLKTLETLLLGWGDSSLNAG